MKKIVGVILLSFFLLSIYTFNRTELLKDNNPAEIDNEELTRIENEEGKENEEAKMEEKSIEWKNSS